MLQFPPPFSEKGIRKKEKGRIDQMSAKGYGGMDGDFEEATGKSAEEITEELGQQKDMLQDSIYAEKWRAASLNKDKAGLELENARLQEQKLKGGGREDFSEKISKNNEKIAGINEEIANAKKSVAEGEEKLSGINRRLQNMPGSTSGFLGNGQRTVSAMQQEIAGRYADIYNFESPEFSHLSHSDKAALYQKRARKNFVSAMAQSAPIASGAILGAGIGGTALTSAIGGSIGATGSTGGALAGFGAGLFYGPALAAQTAGIGSGIVGVGNAASVLAAESLAAHTPHKQKSVCSNASQAYVPMNYMEPPAGETGTSNGIVPPVIGGGSDCIVPVRPFPSGVPAMPGHGTQTNRGAYPNMVTANSKMYDVNERASKYVNKNFGSISSHLSAKMAEQSFHNEVKRGMQGAVSKAGYGQLSFTEKQKVLSRGGAEVFAKSAMDMLVKEGLSSETAEYGQIYNRLMEEFSAEKTIQKMAGAMLDQEKKILDFVDQDRME